MFPGELVESEEETAGDNILILPSVDNIIALPTVDRATIVDEWNITNNFSGQNIIRLEGKVLFIYVNTMCIYY